MAKRISIGGNVKDEIVRDIVQALTTIGYKVALEAYRNARHPTEGKAYTHSTYNLHDSYGSAVYVEGRLVEDSIRYVNRARSKGTRRHGHNIPNARTGREALMRFFKTAWIVRKRDYLTVVIAAPMWYASIVEDKGFVVLDADFVKSEMRSQLEKSPELVRKMKEKYGIDHATLRRWLGIDEVYHYNR